MDIHFIKEKISRTELQKIANERFGDMVKAVVDLHRQVIALGGELHADEESALIEQGSKHEDLLGINLYPREQGESFLEFDSMINIRPALGNRTRGVEAVSTRAEIKKLVEELVTD